MERPKRPYSIQRRPTSKTSRHIYYVKFRDPETGKYRSAVSSGCSTKAAAMNWADAFVRSGKVPASSRRIPRLKEYAESFWDYDKSSYIQGRLARGASVSRGYAGISLGYIRKHVLPLFGDRPMDSIRPAEIEAWILDLRARSGLSSTTINRAYTAFRILLRESARMGILTQDPTASVRCLHETPARKGILRLEEARELFGPDALDAYWDGNLRLMTANLMAAVTGMREGEVRGLLWEHVHKDRIEVRHSWEEKHGLKGAKWGSERVVPIPALLAKALAEIQPTSSDQGLKGFVFPGSSPDAPVSKAVLVRSLYKALGKAGLSEEDRKARNITFHSWRHFFNSSLRGKVPDSKLRSVTGHRTIEMTEHYTQALPEDLSEIRKVQEGLLTAAG